MPLYEYLCTSCGHRFERIQKFSDAPIATCPQCGGPVEKQISSPAIQFKGAGWYVNDYAKSGKSESTAKSNKAEKSGDGAKTSEPAKSETSEPAKTDAPAAKPSSTESK
jgi:putative FmdB family regulatory protein